VCTDHSVIFLGHYNFLTRLTVLLRQRLKEAGWFDDVNDLALGQ
jgi:hypothetical protein